MEEALEWERGVRASLEEAEGQLARSRARVVAWGGWMEAGGGAQSGGSVCQSCGALTDAGRFDDMRE